MLAGHSRHLSSIDEAIARLEIRLDEALSMLEERYRNKAYGYSVRSPGASGSCTVPRAGRRPRAPGGGGSSG